MQENKEEMAYIQKPDLQTKGIFVIDTQEEMHKLDVKGKHLFELFSRYETVIINTHDRGEGAWLPLFIFRVSLAFHIVEGRKIIFRCESHFPSSLSVNPHGSDTSLITNQDIYVKKGETVEFDLQSRLWIAKFEETDDHYFIYNQEELNKLNKKENYLLKLFNLRSHVKTLVLIFHDREGGASVPEIHLPEEISRSLPVKEGKKIICQFKSARKTKVFYDHENFIEESLRGQTHYFLRKNGVWAHNNRGFSEYLIDTQLEMNKMASDNQGKYFQMLFHFYRNLETIVVNLHERGTVGAYLPHFVLPMSSDIPSGKKIHFINQGGRIVDIEIRLGTNISLRSGEKVLFERRGEFWEKVEAESL